MINLQKKIGEIAAENPASLSVFERLEIDYCCHGEQTFEQASREVGLTPGELFALIAESTSPLQADYAPDWTREPLRELVLYIVQTHHAYAKKEVVRLAELCDKVVAAHRENHPELIQLAALLELLREELRPHMLKEEQILFPFVAMMEDAIVRGRPMPVPPFDTVEAPIGMMILEHENAAKLLRDIRGITMDFHIPLDGCASYRALMYGLHEFERNTHLHIHLENNILFPRALALESSAGSKIQYEFANSCGEC